MKFTTTAIVIAIAASLSGCGGSSYDPVQTPDNGLPNSEANSAEQVAEQAAEQVAEQTTEQTTEQAAGPGGTDGATDTVDNVAVVDPDTGGDSNVAPPPAPSVQTGELQASSDFNFETTWDMDIDFSLPLSNAYLSLCTDYSVSDNGAAEVQFDSCIVRAPIAASSYRATDIAMTNHTTSLIAVLIDYANPSVPTYVEFEVSIGQETLEWEQGVSL